VTRRAREMTESGIYHIILRGNEKKSILAIDEEKQFFLDCIRRKQKETNFSLYAYCLMDNHVHLLINIQDNELASIMKGIATRYAFFYNNRHNRVGHVFQDRFKSEPIEDERYLLAAVRYIHNNPVKARMVSNPEDYHWSSYWAYIQPELFGEEWIDSTFILGIIAPDRKSAIKEFIRFSKDVVEETFIDIEEKSGIKTLGEGVCILREYLKQEGLSITIEEIKENKELRQKVIIFLRANTQLSQRKIAILLGIDKSIVEKVKL